MWTHPSANCPPATESGLPNIVYSGATSAAVSTRLTCFLTLPCGLRGSHKLSKSPGE
uniref:Uncharacterized protein n=1 Tax=Anguilla anguilla TaxID=7936 RepID=A0A0E9P9L6_ANGAN